MRTSNRPARYHGETTAGRAVGPRVGASPRWAAAVDRARPMVRRAIVEQNLPGVSIAVTAAVAPLGLTNTGTDSAAEWSPDHIGEPEEDFPLFTIIQHVIFRPIGLALRNHCRAIARRSTSRDPMTILAVDDD